MDYVAANRRVISDAFTGLLEKKELSIQKGLTRALENGVNFCLNNHDLFHQLHLKMGDSYGWLLLHDGAELGRKLFAEGAEAEGNASVMLDEVKGRCPSNGWVGIVLAGMKPDYFQLRYEFWVMRRGIADLTKENFSDYFKLI